MLPARAGLSPRLSRPIDCATSEQSGKALTAAMSKRRGEIDVMPFIPARFAHLPDGRYRPFVLDCRFRPRCRRSRARKAARMMNRHSIDDRQNLMLTCCYQAVREHFSHIAIREIIEPPHGMFDALLARQVAITLMRDAFNVPRRRIATILERQRTTISFAMRTVTDRRTCPSSTLLMSAWGAGHARFTCARHERQPHNGRTHPRRPIRDPCR